MTNRTVLNADPHALAETLIKVLEASPEETSLLLATQQLLLEGQPVAPRRSLRGSACRRTRSLRCCAR